MIKVFLLTGWGESSTNVLRRISSQTPGCSGKWKNLVGTDSFSDADYYVVLENTNVSTPIDRTIYIKREPDFISPSSNLPYKHIIDFDVTNGGVTYWLDKTYDELKALTYPRKNKLISCIVSNKHSHRRKYIQDLFKYNPNIDMYGRGHDASHYGDSYKGELNYNGKCKFQGLVDYAYSIVLENSAQKNYWTEKLADAYLAWCVPIYWGCPNIDDFFPKGSYRLLDFESRNPIKEITKVATVPITNEEIELLHTCRELILDEYNIWEVINKKIKEIND